MHYLAKLKSKLENIVEPVVFQMQKGSFTMTPVKFGEDVVGVEVTNLGDAPGNNLLPLAVFVAVISLLCQSPERTAIRGDGMAHRLGSDNLPLNSVEGHVAQVVYGQSEGEILHLRRITPIAHLLAWAGVCENGRGYLKLLP
ncbi:MAG: hypothetical protein ACXW11_08940 [Methylotenera sp.]